MKKLLLFMLALFTACMLSISAFAGTGFIGYLKGNNEYDGKTSDAPKKQFLSTKDNGVMSVIGKNSGTIVIVDRAYIGSNYTFPEMFGKLTITGKYGNESFVNASNIQNPTGGVLKAAGHKVITLGTDTILTDMILFQEAGQNIIVVPSYITLTITDTVQIMTKPGNNYHWKIFLQEDATAILSEEALKKLDIVNRGGTVKLYDNGQQKITHTSLVMTMGNTNAFVNRVQTTLDTAPVIRNSRTMLPARFVAEALGATVEWDGDTSTSRITSYDGDVIDITVGSSTAKINDISKQLASPAFIESGRTYLPVRFIAESLGATIEWDEALSKATINHTIDRTPKIDLAQFDTPKEHSEYYLEGLTPDKLVTFFTEVCVNKNSKLNETQTYTLSKWSDAIYYSVFGEYTTEDIETIESFAAYLNTIDGFPGMHKAPSSAACNLKIYFGDARKMTDIMGSKAKGSNGFVRVSKNYSGDYYDGKICVLSTLKQSLRSTVTRHEIFNGIGAMNDSELRSDSLIYDYTLRTDNLSEEDKVIIKMLYNPKIISGMDEQQCEYVIREVYY